MSLVAAAMNLVHASGANWPNRRQNRVVEMNRMHNDGRGDRIPCMPFMYVALGLVRRRVAGVTVGVGLILMTSVSVMGCASGCPAALLQGTLVAADGELIVEGDAAGVATHVTWPFGVGVRDDGGELVLTDLLGTVKAREGDVVGIGGSSTSDGSWLACGDITVTGAATAKAPPE
jgi:hypothetical protein